MYQFCIYDAFYVKVKPSQIAWSNFMFVQVGNSAEIRNQMYNQWITYKL